jgi:hypothetical protein
MIGRFIEFCVIGIGSTLWPDRYRVIPNAVTGKPLLRQFKLFNWAYLQSFVDVEVPGWFHRHRWQRMWSFVLSGGFIEERYPGYIYVTHRAWSVYKMDRTVIHRLGFVEPRTWTLFLMFGNLKLWGYYPRPDRDGGYVPYEKMIPDELRVKPL